MHVCTFAVDAHALSSPTTTIDDHASKDFGKRKKRILQTQEQPSESRLEMSSPKPTAGDRRLSSFESTRCNFHHRRSKCSQIDSPPFPASYSTRSSPISRLNRRTSSPSARASSPSFARSSTQRFTSVVASSSACLGERSKEVGTLVGWSKHSGLISRWIGNWEDSKSSARVGSKCSRGWIGSRSSLWRGV